jgi:hypothetical protein
MEFDAFMESGEVHHFWWGRPPVGGNLLRKFHFVKISILKGFYFP